MWWWSFNSPLLSERLGTPRTTPTLSGSLERSPVAGDPPPTPPLNVSDFFKSFDGDGVAPAEELAPCWPCGGGEVIGGVNPCSGSTDVLVGLELLLFGCKAFLFTVVASRAVRWSIKWTSDEYSPHFINTCQENGTQIGKQKCQINQINSVQWRHTHTEKKKQKEMIDSRKVQLSWRRVKKSKTIRNKIKRKGRRRSFFPFLPATIVIEKHVC